MLKARRREAALRARASVAPRRRTGGFTLLEVLVTIVVLTIGLLGVAGMQTRAASVEFESYQRGQALSLLRDMEARLAASRGILDQYLDASLSSTDGSVYAGSGAGAIDCAAAGSGAHAQVCEWSALLQGAAAREGATNVGAMIGARGCLMRVEPPQGNALADFFLVIVWQGLTPGVEPPDAAPAGRTGCASAVDFGAGLRRGVALRVLVPNLTQTL
ncbi:MAG: type IV pilus modification protein PilV [Burkholderiaceae bacterium]|nr:type IV pilus modification protein PilV [Burkholderiaceae bacterium]